MVISYVDRKRGRFYFPMTNLINQIGLEPIQNTLQKGIATLALVTLVTGQPVPVQNGPVVSTGATSQAVAVAETAPEPEAEHTVQDVLLSVCQKNGYGADCAKHLLGMLWTESSNRSTVIGDAGKARGYFQIHYKLHKISSDCAEDLVCSAEWTLNYLERNSYPKYVNYAIQCHNGCNANNGYVNKVHRYATQFWHQPLVVEQAAPIELALN